MSFDQFYWGIIYKKYAHLFKVDSSVSKNTVIHGHEPLPQSIFPESSLVLLSNPSPPTKVTLFWYFHLGLVLHVLKPDTNGIIQNVFFCIQLLFPSRLSEMSILLYIHSFVLLSVLLYRCTKIRLSFLFDIWVVSSLEKLWVKPLWIFIHRSLCGKNSLG